MLWNKFNVLVIKPCVFCQLRRNSGDLQRLETVEGVLTNYLGFDNILATRFAKKNKFKSKDVHHLKENIAFCENLNFTKEDYKKYPSLLKRHPTTLDQHYRVLLEGGFAMINAYTLAKFRKLTNEPIGNLKERNLISGNINVADRLVSYLNPVPDKLDISDLTDEISFSLTHTHIMKRYLMWRLEATQEEIEKLLRVYQQISLKSLHYLCENIAITQELNFHPIRKLLKFGYLLHMYPHYPKTVLKNWPNLAGSDLRVEMRRYPKIVMVSPKNYMAIYKMLKEAGIPDEAIQKTMNIFQVSPATVDYRLQELKSVPDFKIHMHDPLVLRLIVHYNRAKHRLSFLQEVKLKCRSLRAMGEDGKYFEEHIRQGVDMNIQREVVDFVKHLLGSTSALIRTNIKKHPFYLRVPLQQIQDTYYYLNDLNIEKDALIQVIQILFYTKDEIDTAFKKIAEEPQFKNKILEDRQKLNLALYYIEKNYHFR